MRLFELCDDHAVSGDHPPWVRGRGQKAIDARECCVRLVVDPTDLGFRIQGSGDSAGEQALGSTCFEGSVATAQGIFWSHAGYPDLETRRDKALQGAAREGRGCWF